MITVTTILTVAALLCLAFNNTRLIGIVGVVILFLIYPLLVTIMDVLEDIISHLVLHF